MGLSTKGPITPYHGSWADHEHRRRSGALLLASDHRINDPIVMASIRENIRLFGIDRIRGL